MHRYTASQLLRALGRIKAEAALLERANRVDVAQAPDGTCLVKLIEQARDQTLNVELRVLKLNAEETRAWRAELQNLSRPAGAA